MRRTGGQPPDCYGKPGNNIGDVDHPFGEMPVVGAGLRYPLREGRKPRKVFYGICSFKRWEAADADQ